MMRIILAVAYVTGPILIIALYRRFKAARQAGTVLMAYGAGILLSLLRFLPVPADEQAGIESLQQTFMNAAVPLAIPLMLLSSDFSLWRKSLRKTFNTLIGGVLSVSLAIVLAFLLFRNQGITDLWKAAGMMAGMFTGGTMNFVAIGQSLHVDANTFLLFTTFEMVLSFLFLLFIIGGGFRLFRRILPYSDAHLMRSDGTDGEDGFEFEQYAHLTNRNTLRQTAKGLLLSIVIVATGAGLSLLLTGRLDDLAVILTITGLAVACSLFRTVREWPGTFELGMYFILMFSLVIASQFDLRHLSLSNLNVIGFIAFVILVATLLHLLLSRIFMIPGDLFTVVHVSMLYSPPFVPPVAGAMHNRKVLVSGIVTGLAGYALGTYLGVALAEALKLLSAS